MIVYRELSSIEADLGVSAKTLYGLSNNISKHYLHKDMPKSDGGIRHLLAPDEALKNVQRAIAEKLLSYEPVSKYATAYKPASGVIKNAKRHIGKPQILKLDIRNFFDSIKYSSVKDKAFPQNRYSENIRILLCMLCYYKDVLPQGAPTSPAISNIIMYDFDNIVGKYCSEREISYTRYCDDMTFSGNLSDADGLIEFVGKELLKEGFLLNRRKTRLVSSSERQTVTGIVVNEKLNITTEYKRQIRKEVFYLKKYGAKSHLCKIGSNETEYDYLMSLLGRIGFVLQVCPDNKTFTEYKKDVLKMLDVAGDIKRVEKYKKAIAIPEE